MNANQIKNHLAQVFEQDYRGYEHFVEHVINLIFTDDDAYEALPVPEEIIDETNRKAATNAGIQSILKIGRIDTIGGIDVYDITLRDNKQLQYNRVGIQQLIRSQQIFYSSAFLLFHNEHSEGKEWRFSFFYKEGKNKDTTSAKRFTYLFGKDFRARTASERFAKLVNEEKDTQNLLDAFSVEALSKDFFNEYKDLYNQFCGFLFKHRADVDYFGKEFLQWEDKYLRDYVKKMMGRITFIYFLQRKGWMNGDMEYMQKAFANSACQDDYLDAFLEPLFFGVLNTKPEDRKALFAKEGWDLSLLEEWKDVPYLNGGLFERDDQDKPKSKFPAEMFKDLFDFYARYNFTIDENDPDDAEVGVDPEMLGHIFENLLEDNKDKGAFYTPKEIVRYMSEESIAQYLKTHAEEALHSAIDALIKERKVDEVLQTKAVASAIYALLQEVKVCDPAIGSGAFPMGVLNVLYHARLMLYGFIKPQHEFSPADVKREIIQNNIYGVDIEKGAIDIARLRFWLSIVVDSNQPEALPNFDYKFMQGNSLLEEFGGIDLSSLQDQIMQTTMYEPQRDLFGNVEDSQMKMTFTQKETANNLQVNLEKYFSIDDHTQKQAVKEEISNAVKNHISYNIEMRRDQCLCLIQEANEAISDEESQIEVIKSSFSEDKMPMDEIRKHERKISKLKKDIGRYNKKIHHYDSVCRELESIDLTSNESFFLWHTWFRDVFDKGGFDVVIGNPPYVQLQNDKSMSKVYQEQNYRTFNKSGDLYCLMVEHGFNIMKTNGLLCFIMSNKWMQAEYGKQLRTFIIDNRILNIIDFGDTQVFENVTTYTCIVLLQNAKPNNTFSASYLKTLDISSIPLVKNDFEVKDFGDSAWVLTSGKELKLLNKINKECISLREYIDGEAYRGILTGLTKAFLADNSVLGNDNVVPFLLGRDLKPYTTVSASKYLILFPKGFTKKFVNSNFISEKDAWKIIKTAFPDIAKHLEPYAEKARKRGDKGDYWWELRACDYYEQFSKPKIMYQAFQVKPCFVYDEKGLYCNNSMWILPTDNKALLGVFNSKMGWWLISKYCSQIQNGYQLIWKYFGQIPIPYISPTQQSFINTLVDKILAAKKTNPQADTSAWEEEIDGLVYKLYGLNYDEVLVVDPRTPITKEEYDNKEN